MSFIDLFEVPQTGNRIDILHIDKRMDVTYKTRDWWHSQGWEVHLWDNTGYNPAQGQNRILDDWRQSDRAMLIMAHDDVTLYTHRFLTQSWLEKPIQDKGVYTLNSNLQMHHQMLYTTGWHDGNHHWTPTDQICKMFVISDRKVPRFDEQTPSLEDQEFSWACFAQGIPTYRLNTAFLREQGIHTQDTWGFKPGERKALYKKSYEYIFAKYGITKKSEFRKQYGIKP